MPQYQSIRHWHTDYKHIILNIKGITVKFSLNFAIHSAIYRILVMKYEMNTILYPGNKIWRVKLTSLSFAV